MTGEVDRDTLRSEMSEVENEMVALQKELNKFTTAFSDFDILTRAQNIKKGLDTAASGISEFSKFSSMLGGINEQTGRALNTIDSELKNVNDRLDKLQAVTR